MNWTINDIPDLKGKVIIVTGGNSGLGYESVKALSGKGAQVVLASRNPEKGEAAKAEILKSHPEASIEVMALDLGKLASIRNFASEFNAKHETLHVLLNNAGIMMTPYFTTNDGFEGQLGTNHFGHFALTGLLMEKLLNTPGSRVVSVSSMAHKRGSMDFSNLQYEDSKDYSPMKSYGRSKLANMLFTYELQRKLNKAEKDVISVAAHPGIATTNLARHMENRFMFKLLNPLFKRMAQDQADGALPQIRAAVDPEAKGSQYYGPGGKREWAGPPVLVASNEASHSKEDAAKLWEESERLTEVQFGLA